MNLILEKLKEMASTVIPIAIIVFIVNFTLIPLGAPVLIRFLIGTVLVIVGLALFLIGVDIGITPFGDHVGESLARSNKLWLIVAGGLILGFFISIAEPGLLVLGAQIDTVTQGAISATSLFIVVSVGMAFMISVGFLRVFFNVQLKHVLFAIYTIIFALAIFTSEEFLAISFDASGATTGVLAVPFILALSTGISKLKKDSVASEEDSFGLVALASSGAIVGVMFLDIFTGTKSFSHDLSLEMTTTDKILKPFIDMFSKQLNEAVVSLLPLLLIYIVLQLFVFKLDKRENRKILTGFFLSFVGLLIFLLGVNGGFFEVGVLLGQGLAVMETNSWLLIITFLLGLVTILAEPAVYVLTNQIEDVTSGSVKKSVVSIFLCVGVGLAVALSVLRIINPNIKLWYFLLPGYILALSMMKWTPNLFIGIAFDAGGTATGPMTATFILAFVQGVADASPQASLLTEGFGMIALVAMAPIVALQILGIIFNAKSKRTKGA